MNLILRAFHIMFASFDMGPWRLGGGWHGSHWKGRQDSFCLTYARKVLKLDQRASKSSIVAETGGLTSRRI